MSDNTQANSTAERSSYDPRYILEVENLKKYFPIKGGMMNRVTGHVKAVDGVSTPPLGFALEQEIISCSRARETA